MEDLALIVTLMLAALFLFGLGSVVLSLLSRRKRVSKVPAVIVASIITIFGIVLLGQQDMERVAAIPILWGVLASAIALWPASQKTKTKPKQR
jgi:hypothetical protein